MKATIRKAGMNDAPALAELNRHVQDLHVEERPDYFKPFDVATVRAWFESILQREDTAAWIAEAGGDAVAYVLAFIRSSEDNPFSRQRTWIELDQLAVDPAARRQGLARMLVDEALVEAGNKGIDSAELNTWSFNNRARSSFEKMGFRPRMVRFEKTAKENVK